MANKFRNGLLVLVLMVALNVLMLASYIIVERRQNILLNSQKVIGGSRSIKSYSSEFESEDQLRENTTRKMSGAQYQRSLSLASAVHASGTALPTRNMHLRRNLETVSRAHQIVFPKLDAEMKMVMKNMDSCLAATNMKDFFIRMGYMHSARKNAQYFLDVIRTIVPKTFDPKYDVPCWKMNIQVSAQKDRMIGRMGNLSFNETCERSAWQHALQKYGNISTSVACLPKVFVAGYPKCGSTYLYCVLKTPNIDVAQFTKEPHWWIAQHGPKMPTTRYIAKYLFNFIPGSHLVKKSRYALTVDATPNLIFKWPHFVDEEPLVNYCLMPSLLPVILPDSKYIVVMRNPVALLYSAFWYTCTMYGHGWSWTEELKLRAPTIFHERIVAKIKLFNECMQRQLVLEECVLNITFFNSFGSKELKCGKTELDVGLYYVHVHKWLSVIPREKFIFLTLEELSKDTIKKARELWKFVGIPNSENISAARRKRLCDAPNKKNSQQAVDYHSDPRLQMRNDTKELLTKFYHPFNKKLADILSDDKFLWKGK